jgi:archaellum biogenesis protein FlaJ (TadC family)
MEYYVSIHMSIILVVVSIMVTVILYVTPLLVQYKWPNMNLKMGVFYALIAVVWLGSGWLLFAPTS